MIRVRTCRNNELDELFGGSFRYKISRNEPLTIVGKIICSSIMQGRWQQYHRSPVSM